MEPVWNYAIQSGLLEKMRNVLEFTLDGKQKQAGSEDADSLLRKSV